MLTQEDMKELYQQANEVLPVSKAAQEIYRISPNYSGLERYRATLMNERLLWMLNQAYNKGKHDAGTQ